MNRVISVVLFVATAAIVLPSAGCIVHRGRRPPPREVVVVHEHRR